jgi:hypothetical protein
MSECKKCRALFLEHFYGELNASKEKSLKDHLSVCKKCLSEFDKMKSTLELAGKRVRPDPPEEFWDGYEERLAERIQKNKFPENGHESWWERWWRDSHFAPKWAFQAAAALLLIFIGVFIGRIIFSPSIPEARQYTQQKGFVSEEQPGTALIHRSQDYIERSKLILLALVNFDPVTEDPYALDLPYQQQVSRELVREASLLKKELAQSDQKRLEDLIASLEIILLQIANLESESDFEAIELVKEGIEGQGILMEINLSDLHRSIKKEDRSVPRDHPLNKPKTL